MKTLFKLGDKQRGFTIIEALVAMLIMSFGLMAVSAMQINLAKNSDISRQRSEATRLADQKMENLRAYTQIETGTGITSWNGMMGLSSNPEITVTSGTNARYTITTSYLDKGYTSTSSSFSTTMRIVAINVAWDDRAGAAQKLTITSIISRSDPKDIAYLSFPLRDNTNLKELKNRSLDIPIPAVTLDNSPGNSSYYVSDLNSSVIFSNTDGSVVKYCRNYNVQKATSAADISQNCTTIIGVILAGYVYDPLQVLSSNNSNTTYNISGVYTCSKNSSPKIYTSSSTGCDALSGGGYSSAGPSDVSSPTTLFQCTASSSSTVYYVSTSSSCPSTGSGKNQVQYSLAGAISATTTGAVRSQIDTSGMTWHNSTTNSTLPSQTVTCSFSQATNQNTGASIDYYKYYMCIIYTGTNVTWSGSIKLKGIPTTGQYLNCAVQYSASNLSNNQKHPVSYSSVSDSLDNQNYYIYTSTTQAENSSPTCNTSESVFSDWTGASAAVQQDCRNLTSNTSKASNCPAN